MPYRLEGCILTRLAPYVHPDEMIDFAHLDYLNCGDHYEWLYGLVERRKPHMIAEIGTRYGYGAAAMRLAAPAAAYVGYEIDTACAEWARENLSRFSEPTTVIATDTQECCTLPLFEKDSADFIYIDGDKSPQGVRHDCDLALKALAPEGMMVVPDCGSAGSAQAAKKWAIVHGLKWHVIPSYRGFLVCTRGGVEW